MNAMKTVARALVAPGKGILAADESAPTIAKRLANIGLESTEERRRAYRDLLFTAPGIEDYISGVILFDETIRQRDLSGVPFPTLLAGRGIIPGIKVDKGVVALTGFPNEKVTEGLDGLAPRLAEYAELGARFAKWRAVITIGDGIPSQTCLDANAYGLARYAAMAQATGLVPIVEPEVLMDGTHDIARCAEVTTRALRTVYDQLARHRVDLGATLLKPNMVLPGASWPAQTCPAQAELDEIAEATVAVLREAVPAAVPGIVFLSGGQSDEMATARLNAINRLSLQPWELSFSYGRALQAPVLAAWRGEETNRPAAQEALLHRARMNSAARRGAYDSRAELAALPT